jgi:hypothetical protein
MCGPVWATWAFPMERYCGKLQRAVKGRRYVWASIDNWVLRTAQAAHIRFRYNLTPADTRFAPPPSSRVTPVGGDCKLDFLLPQLSSNSPNIQTRITPLSAVPSASRAPTSSAAIAACSTGWPAPSGRDSGSISHSRTSRRSFGLHSSRAGPALPFTTATPSRQLCEHRTHRTSGTRHGFGYVLSFVTHAHHGH